MPQPGIEINKFFSFLKKGSLQTFVLKKMFISFVEFLQKVRRMLHPINGHSPFL